ncbi:UDP-N-acetylmuramoyl-tripeptide--D-alanyl-D-alanine ligase [Bacteriovoracales bacterium]|nr:UDP-N-acetylmuramoyl-tripeptide--D-alanyl-D-alanine ligase [Bacteriovoracales bacterium]
MIEYDLLKNIRNIKKIYGETRNSCFDSLSTDSRNIKKGQVFLGIKGDRFDGFQFVQMALKAAPVLIFQEEEGREEKIKELSKKNPGKVFMLVEDSTWYLQELARLKAQKWLSAQPGRKIIGITGSNGKTTHKEMMTWLFESVRPGKTLYTQGNLNNHIGVPLTLLRLKEEHDFAIIEMGTNHPGEIQRLCEIASPNAGVLTNIGSSHLEHFGKEEAVFREKRNLFDWVRKKTNFLGEFVLCSDDSYLKTLNDEYVLSFGKENEDIKFAFEGQKASLHFVEEDCFVTLNNKNIIGEHNFSNLACCFLMARGLFPNDSEKLLEAASLFRPFQNRGALLEKRGKNYFLDAYNANPSSMRKSLEGFIDYCLDQKIELEDCYFILGDMNELGPKSDLYHKEIGSYLKQRRVLKTSFIGKFSELYEQGYGGDASSFCSVEEFLPFWEKERENYKYFFIKASRSLQLESLVDITF